MTELMRRLGVVPMLLAACLAIFAPAGAVAYEPIHSASALNSPVPETVVQVRTARVVLADYGLIRRDFPSTRHMSDAQIDQWLVSKVGFIARPQAAQAVVNTPIPVGEATTRALRPRDYGRALVYEAGPGELIDAKGAGSLEPGVGGHSSGLATLGETIREFLYEKLVRTLFVHGGAPYDTVGHYGVIDWGFDVIHADGSKDPAGMILREAHRRMPGTHSVFDNPNARAVEMSLRKYGVTTAGAYRNDYSYDMVNVQGTPDGAIVDFGGFLAVEGFDRPGRNIYGHIHGNDFIINLGDLDFVQPDVLRRVPFDTWGYGVTGVADPKMDNPWVWSHELARSLENGTADRAAAQRHFDNLVGTYRRALFAEGGEASHGAMEALVGALEEVH